MTTSASFETLPKVARRLLANPEWIDQELAERSLHEFISEFWSTVEGERRFVDNWHIGAICEHLEAVNAGEIKRLLINIPPRHQKSLTCNVFWPAWTWIQRGEFPLQGPQVRFLCASHGLSLTLRDSVRCRAILESEKYRRWWGDRFQISRDQNAKHRYSNTKAGERLCTAVSGKVLGEGGDIGIIDDPQDPKRLDREGGPEAVIDWWRYEMSTRLNDPSYGAFVGIMQRLHQRDFSGFVLEAGGWTHLCLPARYEPQHPHLYPLDPRSEDGELLWPDFATPDYIDGQETELGSYGFAGQFQQRPSPRSGGMFEESKWGYVEAVPGGGQTVRAWDLAATEEARGKGSGAAYTVGLKMKRVNDRYYIMHVLRFRGGPAEVRKAMKATAVSDGYGTVIDFPQDPGQAGKDQKQSITAMLAGFRVKSTPETGAKDIRAEPFAAQQEAGNVYLVKGPWNQLFVEEAAFFPNGQFSDQIDAGSRAFARLARRQGAQVIGHY